VHHDFPERPYDVATLSILAVGHAEGVCRTSFLEAETYAACNVFNIEGHAEDL
jgi:hypothetical protein